MVQRVHLDVVERASERIWFTLVIENPIRYYVEQYHEPHSVSFSTRTREIQPDELARTWVNDQPLIKLVESKFQEMAERDQPQSQAA